MLVQQKGGARESHEGTGDGGGGLQALWDPPWVSPPVRKEDRIKEGARVEKSGSILWVQIPTPPLTEALSPCF